MSVLARVRRLLPLVALLALAGSGVTAETITGARYAEPVERYGHFALGRPHEYARLTAITSTGRTLELVLPEAEVFEDLAPRLVRLAADEPPQLLTIVSHRARGARLALVRAGAEGLVLGAQSPAIGTPMRWLNPVGVADLDGDGRAEIAAVLTPHLGGTLKVYRPRGDALVEVAALDGFSNHVYGSPELGLSMPVTLDGQPRLVVPDATRRQLRIVALQGERLVETGRCALAAPITGPLGLSAPGEVAVGLHSGRHLVVLRECRG